MFIRKEKFARSLYPVAFRPETFRPASRGQFIVEGFWVDVVKNHGLVVKHGLLHVIPATDGVFIYEHLFTTSDYTVVKVSDSAWDGKTGYVIEQGALHPPRYTQEAEVDESLKSIHDLLPEVPVSVDGWYYWKEV